MRRLFRNVLIVAVVFCLFGGVLTVAGCGKKAAEEIKIGVVLPLTGSAADQGKDILGGIELALDEINASRVPGEPLLKLITEDDMSTPNAGVSALNKMIQTDRPVAVIGPIASSIMLAMIPIAEREKTVLLSPAASSPKISNSGEYIFRVSLLAPPQTKALADFAVTKLKKNKAAILYVNDDSGASYRDAFRQDFVSRGGSIVFEESYEKTSTDFKAQLIKLRESQAEFTFVPGIPHTIGLIHRQAKELGLDMQFLGNYGAEGETLLTSGGDAVEGFIYTSIPISQQFVDLFQAKYKRNPTIGAPLGYDALMIIWGIAHERGANSEAIQNRLKELRDYKGATGLTTMLPSGDAEKEVCLKTVRDGKFVQLQ